MQITFVTRKFRIGLRNLHCDEVHLTIKWVFCLTLDCNDVFAINAYCTVYNIVHLLLLEINPTGVTDTVSGEFTGLC